MPEFARTTEHLKESPWLIIVVGLLGAAAGIVVIAQPAIALATLAVIAGIFLVVDGIMETVPPLIEGSEWPGPIGVVLGLASVVIGVILIRHPLHGVVAVALLVGLWLIISGIVRFASALGADRRRIWNMGIAVIELVAGVVIVSSPRIGVSTLALLVSISFLVRGVALCGIGWLLLRLPPEHETSAHGAVAAR